MEPRGDHSVTLTLHYDPRVITLSELDKSVRQAGACLAAERVSRVLRVKGMVSMVSESAVERELNRLPTVAASASFASSSVRVEFDHDRCKYPEIEQALERLGLKVVEGGETTEAPVPAQAPAEGPWGRAWQAARAYPKLAMAAIGGLLVLSAYLVKWNDGLPMLRWGLVIPAFILCGWYTFQDTVRTLRGFQFDVDVLMFVAALGAAAIGHPEEGALLLFLFALGTGGEEMAMDKARHAIAALGKLAPETAIRRSPDGVETHIRVEELVIGDIVIVRPFDRMPADGEVRVGASAVDQSPITGESIPVEKVVGDPVFAGTINGDGLMQVTVGKLASQSTLARVIRMVNEAQTAKSPTQVFTDRVERWYVPIVLAATAALVFVPPLFWGKWIESFYRAMAFLTAASPCALAIGTPAAVLSGIARAARIGVLIKGGVHLENLGRVKVVAFDKTGTLTRGRPELTDVVPLFEMAEADVLALAGALERNSSHPLAKAIAAEAFSRGCAEMAVTNLEQIPARGVRAMVDGRRVLAGSLSMLPSDAPGMIEAQGAIKRLSGEGKTTVMLGIDGAAVAVLGLSDRPRDNAAQTIARLRQLGVARSVMLTGDHETVAAAMAREVGVDEVFAELLPEHKVDVVRRLIERDGAVAMVGDGVNDAPAMAGATVGIAMGGAGTDVALETADVVLMADDLGKLPEAIGLSRFSRRIIKQNLAIALGVIAVVSPIAALGLANLPLAVVLHEGSTVVVVLNSLRLLMYRSRAAEPDC